MVLISVNVSDEMVRRKKNDGVTWSGLINAGLRMVNLEIRNGELEHEIRDLKEELLNSKSEAARKGRTLGRYLAKYGVDNEIYFEPKNE